MGIKQTVQKSITHAIRKRKTGTSLLLSVVMIGGLITPFGFDTEAKAKAAAISNDKVMFTGFEDDAFVRSNTGNSITQDTAGGNVLSGRQALKYSKPKDDWQSGQILQIKSVSGSAIDVSAMTRVVINIKDTQGSNGFPVKLVDSSGHEKEFWTNDVGAGSANKDIWTPITIPLDKYKGSVDLASLSRIEMWEWNKGDYYLDDIYFEDDAGNRILFQDFEDSVYINNSQYNSVVSTDQRSGSNSLLYNRNDTAVPQDVIIEAADKNGIDAANKEYMVIWVKDTVGSNSFALELTDANGNTSKSGFWTDHATSANSKPESVKDEWVEIVVPMNDILDGSSLDTGCITQVKIWEWNEGNYYIDDIYFTDILPPPVPVADVPSGNYEEAKTLILSLPDAAAGGTIYYTLDGSNPSDSGTASVYSAPVTISSTTTVKAVVLLEGEYGRVLTLNYTIIPKDTKSRVYLQDFERDPGSEVANATLVEITDNVFTGISKAALYTVSTSSDPSEATCFYVGSDNEEGVDTTYYQYLVFWLKDTQGRNTVKIQLEDKAGNKTTLDSGDAWKSTLTTSGGNSIQDTWVEYAFEFSTLPGFGNIDRTKIKGIRIGEWNSGSYYIDDIYFTNALLPATPVSSYRTGTWAEIKELTLSTKTPDCRIYYTTDGSTPTVDSMLYSGAFDLTQESTTLKAIAVSSTGESSLVATFQYRIKELPASGLVFFNTFDTGIDKVSAANGASISISASENDKYYGNNGLKYEMTTLSGTPTAGARSITIKPETGDSVDARLSDYLVFWVKDTQGCNNTYMYLKDDLGNTVSGWTTCSTRYGEWSQYYVDLSAFIGTSDFDLAYLSEITFGFYNAGTYYIDEVYVTDHLYTGLPGDSGPVLVPAAGEILSSVDSGTESTVFQAIELAAESGAAVYYTTDGTTPTTDSTRYDKAIYLKTTTTLKAIAVKDGVTVAEATFIYDIKPAKVFATYGQPGTYDEPVIVKLRSSEDDTPIYYTVDGSDPTVSETRIKYNSFFRIEETATLKAVAFDALGTFSDVSTLEYVINTSKGGVSQPEASVPAGTYGAPVTVALTTKTADAAIYYTTNGSTPTVNSTPYTGAITVSAAMTIKAIAVKGGTISDVVTFNYTINTAASNFLKADGKLIRNNYGTGDKVILRGTNAGGWLVTENWMSPVDAKDQLTMINRFTERFGEEKAWELINCYQDHWWTEEDFDLVKAEGMNLLRLPITYMGMVNADGSLKKTAFDRLDWFIKEAKERDIYVMIDMHGAVGSQNGKDHSGDTAIADIGNFYGNEENIQKTIFLWKAIAARYKNEPMVCGYDLLNEPAATGLTQFEVYDRIYDAIRAIDRDHMIVIEAVWDPSDLPAPSLYGWENVVYEYHFYQWTDLNDTDTQVNFINGKIDEANAVNYDVPVFIGEFTFFANTESWSRCLALFEQEGWSWTTWTFKVTGTGSSWGLYTGTPAAVLIDTDSCDTIKTKWSNITTAASFTRNSTYADVIKTYFDWNEPVKVPYGSVIPTPGPTTPTTTVTPTHVPEVVKETIPMPGINGSISLSARTDENNNIIVTLGLPTAEILAKAEETEGDLPLSIPIASDALVDLINKTKGESIDIDVVISGSIHNNSNVNVSEIRLDQAILDAAKKSGKSITVNVKDENGKVKYSWVFSAKNLTNSHQAVLNVNLALTVAAMNNRTDLTGLLDKKNLKKAAVIDFRHNGVLPAQAAIKFYVGDLGLKKKDKVYLYYYDIKTGKLVTLPYSGCRVDRDGYITVNILHCSEYVLSPVAVPAKSITSLINQIKVSPEKKTLYAGDGKKNTVVISVKLPVTLELISSSKDPASSNAVGAVKAAYSTSNKKIVTVDKQGKVKAIGKGSAWVTVKVTLYSGKTKTWKIKITVK